MPLITWLALIPWMLTPLMLAAGLPFWWAVKHPHGRIDRLLVKLWP